MTFDELLEQIKTEGNPRERLTIQVAQLSADMAMEMIKDLDMISVVRCKDCKHSEDFSYGTREKKYCNLHDVTMREDDYCSRGEMKDDD